MVNTNDLLPFATGAGSNVLPQASYTGLPARMTGFQQGRAESSWANKAIRQSAFVAAMIGQFTMHNAIADVLDDGDVDGFEAKFKKAIQAVGGLRRVTLGGDGSHATATFNPPWLAYTGMVFLADIATSMVAGSDINVDALGAVPLRRVDGTTIQLDDLVAGMSALLSYDGTGLRVLDVSTYAIQHGSTNYGEDTGTADAMVVSLTPTLLRYKKGQRFWVLKGSNANTVTAPTINFGPGVRNIAKMDGTGLASGDLLGNAWTLLGYDGTLFRVLTRVPSDVPSFSIPYLTVEKQNNQALAVGDNTLALGSSFTERSGLPNWTISGGVLNSGADGGLYMITGGCITTGGPGPSELTLLIGGVQRAVQATEISIGFGVNASIGRIVRIPNSSSIRLNVYVTNSGQVDYGPSGSSYAVSHFAAFRIAA